MSALASLATSNMPFRRSGRSARETIVISGGGSTRGASMAVRSSATHFCRSISTKPRRSSHPIESGSSSRASTSSSSAAQRARVPRDPPESSDPTPSRLLAGSTLTSPLASRLRRSCPGRRRRARADCGLSVDPGHEERELAPESEHVVQVRKVGREVRSHDRPDGDHVLEVGVRHRRGESIAITRASARSRGSGRLGVPGIHHGTGACELRVRICRRRWTRRQRDRRPSRRARPHPRDRARPGLRGRRSRRSLRARPGDRRGSRAVPTGPWVCARQRRVDARRARRRTSAASASIR